MYKNAQRVFDSAIKGKGKDIVLKKLRLPFLTPSTHSFRKQGMKVVKKHKKNKKVFTFQYIPKNYILRSAVFLLLFLFVLFLDKLFVVYLVESSYKHLQSISSETQDTEHTLEKSYTRLIIADILFKPFLVFSHPDVINGYAAIQAGKSLVQ
ncbi:MAG: hypothetical protein H6767_00995 [Candidatus Peribacteria bacterium]|nr:MAG: hypothetical protein H6767_00995 [Candidatus Peribacteria bacterium]